MKPFGRFEAKRLRGDGMSSHQVIPPGPPWGICRVRESGPSLCPNSIRPHRWHVDLTV